MLAVNEDASEDAKPEPAAVVEEPQDDKESALNRSGIEDAEMDVFTEAEEPLPATLLLPPAQILLPPSASLLPPPSTAPQPGVFISGSNFNMARPLPKPSTPRKSALKHRSPESKRRDVSALDDESDDTIVFTQPEAVLERPKKRKAPAQLASTAKRVKFDPNVAIFTMSADSLEFTDKKHDFIHFDDEPFVLRPIQVHSTPFEKFQPTVAAMSPFAIDEVAPDPKHTTPKPEGSHAEDDMNVIEGGHATFSEEEDPLQTEWISSQSGFHLPMSSPSQPRSPIVIALPPAPFKTESTFPSLYYDENDEDSPMDDVGAKRTILDESVVSSTPPLVSAGLPKIPEEEAEIISPATSKISSSLISPIKQLPHALPNPRGASPVQERVSQSLRLSPTVPDRSDEPAQDAAPSTQEEEAGRLVAPADTPLFVHVTSNDEDKRLRVLTFTKKPPTRRRIERGLQNIGQPFLLYQEPFYALSEDPAKFNQPKDKMIGNKIDLKAFTMGTLPHFGADLLSGSLYKPERKLTPLTAVLGPTGRSLRVLTPARPPPKVATPAPPTESVHASAPSMPNEQHIGEEYEPAPASPMAWPGYAHHAPKVTSVKAAPSARAQKKQDASQIEQPTPNNSFGFLFSQGFEPTASDSTENQGLTLLSLEVHGSLPLFKL